MSLRTKYICFTIVAIFTLFVACNRYKEEGNEAAVEQPVPENTIYSSDSIINTRQDHLKNRKPREK